MRNRKGEERESELYIFFIAWHGNLIQIFTLASYSLERSCLRKSAFTQIGKTSAYGQFIAMSWFHILKRQTIDFGFFYLQKIFSS